MGTQFAHALLLSLAAAKLGGAGSASQAIVPGSDGIPSLGGIARSTVVFYQETDGRDISQPFTEPIGESFIALEDRQRFVIESREYANKLSSGEASNSKSHPFHAPKASSPLQS